METNQQCSTGTLLESQCHQTTYSKTVGIEPFDNLPWEGREILMWRTGLSITNSNPTTCLHHMFIWSAMLVKRHDAITHLIFKKGFIYCRGLIELQARYILRDCSLILFWSFILIKNFEAVFLILTCLSKQVFVLIALTIVFEN